MIAQADNIELAIATDWHPSDNQRSVLQAFIDADYGISVSEACRNAGVDRTCLYKWMNNDSFVQWWNNQRERRAALALTQVDTAMINAAIGKGKGNPSAAKLVYERFDPNYVPASRTESTSVELHGDIGAMLAAKVAEIAARVKPVLDVQAVLVLPESDEGPKT